MFNENVTMTVVKLPFSSYLSLHNARLINAVVSIALLNLSDGLTQCNNALAIMQWIDGLDRLKV